MADHTRLLREWAKAHAIMRDQGPVPHAILALLDENDRLKEALLGIIGIHHADPDGGMGFRDGGYGHYDNACATCGTSDEYAVEWPCSTVLAARAALESSGGTPPAQPLPTVEELAEALAEAFHTFKWCKDDGRGHNMAHGEEPEDFERRNDFARAILARLSEARDA